MAKTKRVSTMEWRVVVDGKTYGHSIYFVDSDFSTDPNNMKEISDFFEDSSDIMKRHIVSCMQKLITGKTDVDLLLKEIEKGVQAHE